jgi:pyruvate/2-oxoglutarate dehydrogenase complex dihydrolipoamide acyltransferase (E2) component
VKLRLEMPFVDKSVHRGAVYRWHISEGDPIHFGTDVCDLLITEIKRLRRSVSGDEIASQSVMFLVRITASEPATLRVIQAKEGSSISVGDLLAIVSTEPAEPIGEGPPLGAPLLRVVAERVDAAEVDDV